MDIKTGWLSCFFDEVLPWAELSDAKSYETLVASLHKAIDAFCTEHRVTDDQLKEHIVRHVGSLWFDGCPAVQKSGRLFASQLCNSEGLPPHQGRDLMHETHAVSNTAVERGSALVKSVSDGQV